MIIIENLGCLENPSDNLLAKRKIDKAILFLVGGNKKKDPIKGWSFVLYSFLLSKHSCLKYVGHMKPFMARIGRSSCWACSSTSKWHSICSGSAFMASFQLTSGRFPAFGYDPWNSCLSRIYDGQFSDWYCSKSAALISRFHFLLLVLIIMSGYSNNINSDRKNSYKWVNFALFLDRHSCHFL